MQSVVPMAQSARQILGMQNVRQGVEYRLLKNSIVLPVSEGMLLYNLLTKEMIMLDAEETEILEELPCTFCENLEYLITHWFLVPYDMDEKMLADQVRTVASLLLEQNEKSITGFTIFTTTDCNARCFYCFEQNNRRMAMAEQTARDVAVYIKKKCGSQKVKITWFGGEPLFNSHVIDVICEELEKSGVVFSSRIVSNGYLFDDEMVEKARHLWKVKDVQITLDGTERVYNKIKAFIYKEENAYVKVMDNMERLLKAEMKVVVRLNMGRHNIQDLYQLCDELAVRFGGYKKFRVALALLYEDRGSNSGQRTDTKQHELYHELFALEDYIERKKIASYRSLPKRIKLNHCMADSDSAVTILPDGKLGKCEHFLDSEFFGNIYSDNVENAVIDSWKERHEEWKECRDCLFYPTCSLIKKCPVRQRKCDEDERRLKERQLKKSMRHTWEIFREQAEKEKRDTDLV